jgi:hypothetical protein
MTIPLGARSFLPCNSNTIHIFQCKADAAFLIVGLKIYMERHCLRPFLYLVHSGIVTIEDNDSLNLKIYQKNFIILEVKTSEKGDYSVTFSIR